MQGLFITGTDTNVGKTYIGCLIASGLYQRGVNVLPRKPIETGCKTINGNLHPLDAHALFSASQSKTSLDQVCPYRYTPAISPHLAIRRKNGRILLQNLLNACTNNIKKDDFLLIEGAGGFYSPLCEDALNANLAEALKLPVVLVIDNKLGAINQTLLALSAIEKHQLNVHAIVLSCQNATIQHDELNNAEELSRYTSNKIYQVDYEKKLPDVFYEPLF